MEIHQIIRILLRRWYVIVIPVILAAIFTMPDLIADNAAASGGFRTVMRYTAGQTLDAIPNRDGDYQDVWLASELTVNAFTDWVRTYSFAEEVASIAAENGLDVDPAALAIAADNERSIGQIFIDWSNPEELATLADAAIEALRFRNQAYFPQLGDAPAQVEILDDPRISPLPAPLPNRFRPLLQLGLVVFAAFGLVFVIEYLDPLLHDKNELRQLGIRVVSTIPREK